MIGGKFKIAIRAYRTLPLPPIRHSVSQALTLIFIMLVKIGPMVYKHLKKSNASCFYLPIVLKLLIIVQMWKHHEEGN